MRQKNRVLAFAVLVLAGTLAGAEHALANPLDASVRHLRMAMQGQRDGSHLSMLLALRQLRDPQLASVFERLLTHPEWQVQVHAVLGLAEIDSAGQISPAHVARIAPIAQEAVIASALDLKLLSPDRIPALRALENLHPMARLLLYAELTTLGRHVDMQALRALSEHEEFRIAALASLLLAQRREREAFDRMQGQLRREGRAGERKLLWMLEAIRQYQLTATGPWLRSLLRDANLDRRLVDAAVLSAVSLDASANIDLWRNALGPDASLTRRVRYGLMLLSCENDVPATAYDVIGGDDELTIRLANAGRAVSSGADASSAIIELLNFGHVRSMEWAVEAAEKLSNDEAQRVYTYVIDRLIEADGERETRSRGPRAEWIAAGIKATSKLVELDPDAAMRKLQVTDPAGEARQALLLGLIESRDTAAGQAARSLDLTGFGLAESLAILLIARHSETLTPNELTRLGLVASGGGRLSDDLRAQAAWMYIKRSGNVATALPRILNENEGSRP